MEVKCGNEGMIYAFSRAIGRLGKEEQAIA
jgi:hypothetical protein